MKWKTKEGKIMEISDMTNRHLLNAQRMCRRTASICYTWEEILLKEVTKRGLKPLELPPTLDLLEVEAAYDVGIGIGTIFKLKRKEKKMDKTIDTPETYHDAYEFFIAGVQHHQMHKVLADMSVDDILQLVPEPSNKYDPNAVRIEYQTLRDSIMCGYVPRKFSSDVSADIAIGRRLACIVSELNKTAKPWEQCKVIIRELKEEVESDG